MRWCGLGLVVFGDWELSQILDEKPHVGHTIQGRIAQVCLRRYVHAMARLETGADEGQQMVGPFKKLMTALTSHAYLSLRLESHIFEGEEHLSGVQVALSRGLRFLYARPQAKQ